MLRPPIPHRCHTGASCNGEMRPLFARHAEPVSLIGWSLGGIHARELAKDLPEPARCVITLGTPFTGRPRATNAWRLVEFISGRDAHDPADRVAQPIGRWKHFDPAGARHWFFRAHAGEPAAQAA